MTVGTGNYSSTSERVRTSNTEHSFYQKEVLVLGKVLVLGFLSCIGIGIVKTIFQVLVLVLVLLRGFSNYWYWYWYC